MNKKDIKKKWCSYCKNFGLHTIKNCYFYEQKMLSNLIYWCKKYPNVEKIEEKENDTSRVITQRIFVKKEEENK